MQLDNHHPHPAINLLMNIIFLSIGGTIYLLTKDTNYSTLYTLFFSVLGWVIKKLLDHAWNNREAIKDKIKQLWNRKT